VVVARIQPWIKWRLGALSAAPNRMRARRVDSVDELDGALQWSFAAEGPTLLDLRIEYAPHQH